MLDDIELVWGVHPPECDGLGPFVWTTGTFQMRLRSDARFARLYVCYYGVGGILSVYRGGELVDTVRLCHGWQKCAVRLGEAVAGDVIDAQVAPLARVEGETREIGLMVRDVRLFEGASWYESVKGAQDNLTLNQQEYRVGRLVLKSLPPAVRINLTVRCNIPETSQACAYCAWDWAKQAERGAPAFTLQTLDELGDFYRRAVEVNDCSIGEPSMHKDFGPIVARVDQDGKQLSLTTNGQLLSPARRRELLGKNLMLYVSLDAATATGYARYRNDRFDDVIANLKALCREKKSHQDLPRVYVSFIAMRSNVAELPAFFALMREVGVDDVKLRSLDLDDNLPPVTINNGYRFDYAAEVLTMAEAAAAAAAARHLAEQHGVALYVESDQFAGDVGRPGAPACNEPWRTIYVLGRGVMPCCYATQPIARWEEQGERPLDQFLRDVFNGPAYQEIRRELAAGRLADFCRNTPSCPILKDMLSRGLVTAPQNSYQRGALAASVPADAGALPMVPLAALTEHRAA